VRGLPGVSTGATGIQIKLVKICNQQTPAISGKHGINKELAISTKTFNEKGCSQKLI
jgi:hypothetical protein